MATGYGVPVRFTKEKNVWDLFTVLNVGSGGALNTAQSVNGQYINKGIANVWQNTPTFTAVTSSGSATITSVSSFAGIYSGMAIVSSGNLPAGVTVGTITATTGSIVLNGGNASGFTGSTGSLMVVSGGQYIFQFGVLTTVGSLSSNARLDTYNRLLDYNVSYDCSVASSIGTATQQALAPSTSQYVIVANNTTVKTIPAVATAASTDACLIVQFGNSIGAAFVPAVPTPGTVIRTDFTFGNTTSP
jgi:hypothetical protein